MRQLILNNIDVETAERLELRAKRLGTTPEEEASRLLRERLRMEREVVVSDEIGVDPRFVEAPPLSSERPSERPLARKTRQAGLHTGAAIVSDDFDAPLPDDFWLGGP